jgi:chromosome segregation ATPase
LDAYGEAIIRCSLDHTPSTASKLESDIVQASQNVVDYHKAAIVLANQDLQKQLTAKEDRLAWVVSMYEMLRDEEDEQSKEIRRKDKELKEKDMELRQFKNAQAAEEKKKEGEKVRLKEIEKEMEEKRKRVLESWEASKKAKM